LSGDAGVADDMNVGYQFRGEADRIDRAPAGIVGRACEFGDAAAFCGGITLATSAV